MSLFLHSVRLALSALTIVLISFPDSARADFLFSNHAHSHSFKNNTGSTANDLHVNLLHPATGAAPTAIGIEPTTSPFTPATPGDVTLNFTGGSIPNGDSVTVSWESAFPSDDVVVGNAGTWTNDKTPLGELLALGVVPVYEAFSVGNVLVSVFNPGAALDYAGLQIVNGADASFFSPQDFVAGLATGTAVELSVPSFGTFASGFTPIANFAPTQRPDQYAGGSVFIDGTFLAHAANAVIPEPDTWVLFAIGALALFGARRRGSA